MADCELCGKKGQALKKAKIEGLVMSVCLACATYGEEVSLPKKISAQIIRNYAPREFKDPDENKLLVEHIGQKIKQAREKLGLKQEQVAKQLKEKESLIQSIESGKFTPSLLVVKKFEKFFNITLVQELSSSSNQSMIADELSSDDAPLTMGDILKRALEKK